MRRKIILTAFLAAVTLSACGDEEAERPASAPETSTQASPESAGTSTPTNEPSDAMRLRLTFGDTELTGRLDDNATARDLARRLPLTLTFRDHNSAEKTAPLPAQLSTDGAPDGHDPAAGDIGYYAPGGDFVLYYDDAAPYFDGIIRIGEFRGDLTALEQQTDGVRIRIERAG